MQNKAKAKNLQPHPPLSPQPPGIDLNAEELDPELELDVADVVFVDCEE